MHLALLLMAQVVAGTPEAPRRQPQLAAAPGIVAMTYGSGNSVLFVRSTDAGQTLSDPVLVSDPVQLSLGMHRGPRIVIAGDAIVIAAVAGTKGGGSDGDLLAWRSLDGGRTWSGAKRLNDLEGSAREGLHGLASDGQGLIFAVWLDLRATGTRLYGALSRDGGATWSANQLVYESPSGSVCQCCHPTALVRDGRIYVMFRNVVDGARDMYRVRSDDLGKTFQKAEKLGTGTWPLEGCPMDGGSLTSQGDGGVVSVWRREGQVFLEGDKGTEKLLGTGQAPVVATGRRGLYAAWTSGKSVMMLEPGKATAAVVDEDGASPQLVAMPSGEVMAAWERHGSIVLRELP